MRSSRLDYVRTRYLPRPALGLHTLDLKESICFSVAGFKLCNCFDPEFASFFWSSGETIFTILNLSRDGISEKTLITEESAGVPSFRISLSKRRVRDI